jgi:hypothetical protein
MTKVIEQLSRLGGFRGSSPPASTAARGEMTEAGSHIHHGAEGACPVARKEIAATARGHDHVDLPVAVEVARGDILWHTRKTKPGAREPRTRVADDG